jgi:opacity protein-like surface antigen
MRRIAAIVALIFLTSVVKAQEGVTFGAGPHLGIAVGALASTIKDYYGQGLGGGAHFDVNVFPVLVFRMNVEYYSFPSDKDKLKDLAALSVAEGVGWNAQYAPMIAAKLKPYFSDITGGAISFFNVTFNTIGKLPTGTNVAPYALFGFGFHSVSMGDISGKGPTNSAGTYGPDLDKSGHAIIITYSANERDMGIKLGTRFGVNFGAGVDFRVKPDVNLDLGFRYILVFTDEESNGAIPITLGASIRF